MTVWRAPGFREIHGLTKASQHNAVRSKHQYLGVEQGDPGGCAKWTEAEVERKQLIKWKARCPDRHHMIKARQATPLDLELLFPNIGVDVGTPSLHASCAPSCAPAPWDLVAGSVVIATFTTLQYFGKVEKKNSWEYRGRGFSQWGSHCTMGHAIIWLVIKR
jgi:hypothetical protein